MNYKLPFFTIEQPLFITLDDTKILSKSEFIEMIRDEYFKHFSFGWLFLYLNTDFESKYRIYLKNAREIKIRNLFVYDN